MEYNVVTKQKTRLLLDAQVSESIFLKFFIALTPVSLDIATVHKL